MNSKAILLSFQLSCAVFKSPALSLTLNLTVSLSFQNQHSRAIKKENKTPDRSLVTNYL